VSVAIRTVSRGRKRTGALVSICVAAGDAILTVHSDRLSTCSSPYRTYGHSDCQSASVDIFPVLVGNQISPLYFRVDSVPVLPLGNSIETAQRSIGLSMCDGLYGPTTSHQENSHQNADYPGHADPLLPNVTQPGTVYADT